VDRIARTQGAGRRVNALAARIAGLIAAQGPISVAQFMTLALHDPDYGYYATRDPLGARGDFVTAPEITQMFGELLGLWAAQCWHDQGKPSPVHLVELGPGRGTLMADALRAARLMPQFREAIEVVMVESNPVLEAVQRKALADCGVAVRWCGRFEETLGERPLFLLANEFFDALPIRQYVKTERGWCERMVMLDTNGAPAFALSPTPSLVAIPPERGLAPDGAVYEISPPATALVEEIARIVAHKGGAALIVDYGYGNDPGFGETLQAVGAHAFKPLLDDPGAVDLSAHVDFGALAQTARDAGAATFGPIGQGDFLDALGIRARAEQLAARNPNAAETIFTGIDRLIDADQMGTLFKVLAIMPKGAAKPAGF
jgi:NADH dehydrogenase [ubiquinone] 1 alpha subcomplex assembly factor 7